MRVCARVDGGREKKNHINMNQMSRNIRSRNDLWSVNGDVRRVLWSPRTFDHFVCDWKSTLGFLLNVIELNVRCKNKWYVFVIGIRLEDVMRFWRRHTCKSLKFGDDSPAVFSKNHENLWKTTNIWTRSGFTSDSGSVLIRTSTVWHTNVEAGI